jgi:hypothetical protein
LFKWEPEYEAVQSRRLRDPVMMEKNEMLQKKWNDTCHRLEDYQKRYGKNCDRTVTACTVFLVVLMAGCYNL